MSSVNCIDPVLIVSPTLSEDILRCDCYFIDGHKYSIDDKMRFDILNGESVSKVIHLPYVSKIESGKYPLKTFEEMNNRLIGFVDSSFACDTSTGQCYDLWKWVPCGNCDLCNSHKLASLSQRCLFAYEESLAPAYFVTLTYNKSHLPSKSEFVRKHVQLFLKRLRKNSDLLGFGNIIKYIYTCEIGKKGRYHVHMLLFGLPIFDEEFESYNFYRVTKLLQYCWRDPELSDDGFTYVNYGKYVNDHPLAWKVPVDYDVWSRGYVNVKCLTNPKAATNYVVKYAFKNYDNEKFCFRGQSCNMGLEFAKSLKDFALNSKDGKFKYRSKITNQIVEVSLSPYFINKIFPTRSKLVPVEFRRAWCDVVRNARLLMSCPYATKDVKFGAWYSMNFVMSHFSFMSVRDLFVDSDVYSVGAITDVHLINDLRYKKVREWCRGIANAFDVLQSFNLDIDSINKQLFDRDKYLSLFAERNWDEKRKVVLDFRRQIIISISKSTLN